MGLLRLDGVMVAMQLTGKKLSAGAVLLGIKTCGLIEVKGRVLLMPGASQSASLSFSPAFRECQRALLDQLN